MFQVFTIALLFCIKYKIKFKYISGILLEKKERKMIISAFTSSMICVHLFIDKPHNIITLKFQF